ncbi:SPFH domain-containing protein [Streptomyces chiangmaiensis]|uniref:SPFH domain-containing protein n=1 Tax=Streptomyces chiangmaiensis TaxID=766497 RepID=A0ABU7FXR2_9ACTN|nr:SPFH domain-containing protein [Streptomyces chiangmaiensis]MED7828709.1 SPFH domain-containing protein [Streptomyces chiangmaiensis]
MRRRWIVGAAAVAAGLGYAVRAFEVIPSGSAAIVERFGRYSRTLHPGLHTITPFVDTVRNRIDLREQTVPFPLRMVSMYDGNDLPIEFTIQYSVTDPVKATYGTASYIQALERHAIYELTYALANLAAVDARVSLEQIAESVRQVLAPRAQRWGLTFHEFLLTVGEVTTSEVEDKARVAAEHGGGSAQFYASHMTMNVLPNGQITHQSNGRLEAMSSWNIQKQEISGGNVQQGDHNVQDNRTLDPATAQQARTVTAQLLQILRAEQHGGQASAQLLIDEAEVIEGELVSAEQEDRAPDAGLMRRGWQQMREAAAPATIAVAGSAIANLVTQLGQLIGA